MKSLILNNILIPLKTKKTWAILVFLIIYIFLVRVYPYVNFVDTPIFKYEIPSSIMLSDSSIKEEIRNEKSSDFRPDLIRWNNLGEKLKFYIINEKIDEYLNQINKYIDIEIDLINNKRIDHSKYKNKAFYNNVFNKKYLLSLKKYYSIIKSESKKPLRLTNRNILTYSYNFLNYRGIIGFFYIILFTALPLKKNVDIYTINYSLAISRVKSAISIIVSRIISSIIIVSIPILLYIIVGLILNNSMPIDQPLIFNSGEIIRVIERYLLVVFHFYTTILFFVSLIILTEFISKDGLITLMVSGFLVVMINLPLIDRIPNKYFVWNIIEMQNRIRLGIKINYLSDSLHLILYSIILFLIFTYLYVRKKEY